MHLIGQYQSISVWVIFLAIGLEEGVREEDQIDNPDIYSDTDRKGPAFKNKKAWKSCS